MKLNRKNVYAGLFAIGLTVALSTGTACNVASTNEPQTQLESQIEQEIDNSPIELDQELNGAVVYSIIISKREQDTDGSFYWTEWKTLDNYYLGTEEEIYDEEIVADNVKYIKMKNGYVDNSFTNQDFIKTMRLYVEQTLTENGTWILGETKTIINGNGQSTIELDEKTRWKLLETKIVEEEPEREIIFQETVYYIYQMEKRETVDDAWETAEIYKTITPPQDSDTVRYILEGQEIVKYFLPVLYEEMETQFIEGEEIETPKGKFTTVKNGNGTFKPAGVYVVSLELAEKLSNQEELKTNEENKKLIKN